MIPIIQTSHAILLLSGKYLLQLRDNIPTIAAPGEWSLFGGSLQRGEMPLAGIKREIFEELEIQPLKYKKLWRQDYYLAAKKANISTWFFEADVTVVWDKYKLKEGQAAKSFSFQETINLKMPLIMRAAIERHYNKFTI